MLSPKKTKARMLKKKAEQLENDNIKLRSRLETLQIEHSSLQQKIGIMENSRGSVDIYKAKAIEMKEKLLSERERSRALLEELSVLRDKEKEKELGIGDETRLEQMLFLKEDKEIQCNESP